VTLLWEDRRRKSDSSEATRASAAAIRTATRGFTGQPLDPLVAMAVRQADRGLCPTTVLVRQGANRSAEKPLKVAFIHLPIRGEMAEVGLSEIAMTIGGGAISIL